MLDFPLRIARGGRAGCERGWRWHNPPGRDHGFNLWFIAGGTGTLRTAQATYMLHPGDCFLLPMWAFNLGENRSSATLVVPWVCFDLLDAQGRILPPARCPRPREHRRIPNFSFFDEMIQRVLDCHTESPQRQEESVTWLRAALAEVAWQDRRAELSGVDLRQRLVIDELCVRIREKPEQFRGMAQLAAAARCSVDHLIRVFRKHRGVTPWEYVIRCRVEKAAGLLRFSSHTVSEIADLAGYADIYSFSKQFKARTGQTPSAYRRHY